MGERNKRIDALVKAAHKASPKMEHIVRKVSTKWPGSVLESDVRNSLKRLSLVAP